MVEDQPVDQGTACGWKAHEGRWQRYGTFFQEGDTITAMVQNGSMSFLKNGRNLGPGVRGSFGAGGWQTPKGYVNLKVPMPYIDGMLFFYQ